LTENSKSSARIIYYGYVTILALTNCTARLGYLVSYLNLQRQLTMVWGKILGAFFGYLLAGPIGALLGIFIGHFFDRGVKASWSSNPFGASGRAQAQSAFFQATFSVMGYLAKADGHVTEREIRLATEVMRHMNLDANHRRDAIRLFNEGKVTDFDLDGILNRLKRECHFNKPLLQMFMHIQLQAAYADGHPSEQEKRALQRICHILGFAALDFHRIEAMFRAGQTYREYSQQNTQQSNDNSLHAAYDLLGIPQTASDAEVKRAYRKQMSQNHPDKLIAKGLPEEMIKMANAKTQEIKSAYELICQVRNI
jgi:DnaJ like chaperone protein